MRAHTSSTFLKNVRTVGFLKFMDFITKKPKESIYIYAYGKGRHAEVYVAYHPTYSAPHDFEMKIEEAEKFVELLQNAIEDAKKRKELSEDDDD